DEKKIRKASVPSPASTTSCPARSSNSRTRYRMSGSSSTTSTLAMNGRYQTIGLARSDLGTDFPVSLSLLRVIFGRLIPVSHQKQTASLPVRPKPRSVVASLKNLRSSSSRTHEPVDGTGILTTSRVWILALLLAAGAGAVVLRGGGSGAAAAQRADAPFSSVVLSDSSQGSRGTRGAAGRAGSSGAAGHNGAAA